MRRWLVVQLVRCASRGWDASYHSYMRCEEEGLPRWWHDFWTWWACRIEHTAIPTARLLDRKNHWMGQEMAEHGWWG